MEVKVAAKRDVGNRWPREKDDFYHNYMRFWNINTKNKEMMKMVVDEEAD